MPYDGATFPHYRASEIAILNAMRYTLRTRSRWCKGTLRYRPINAIEDDSKWEYCAIGALNLADHGTHRFLFPWTYRFKSVAAKNVYKRLNALAHPSLKFRWRWMHHSSTFMMAYNDCTSTTYRDVIRLLAEAQLSFEAEQAPVAEAMPILVLA